MKKLLVAMLVAILPGMALADVTAVPNQVEVWAQIAGTLNITVVGSTSYDFGTVNAGTTQYSTSALVIQNSGSGLAETMQFKANNSSGGWALVTAIPAGTDTFGLDAMMNLAQPAPISWGAGHTLSAAYVPASITQFAGDRDAYQMGMGESQNLWFRLRTPTTSTLPGRHIIKIDITTTGP